ncbi:uncharacterized protein AB675_498 [Cyphellophora attinorum]|uniref:Uncharacterized protein n=1 Tax=Cyphellophora attinorum TaxID=1664694 RepID=A0A0N1HHY9_9EURO|nr:uncharacterized protein AB675_498 [Phialophora attinorum]KPI45790.1 hypothetical protein AB675_498 [Phialophora attinorum]
MFCNRAELLPEDETVKEHEAAKAEEAKSLAKDRAGRGLFQGIFSRRLPVGPLGRPQFIRDYEDNGILRRLSSVSITNASDSDASIPVEDRHHYDHFSGDHVDTESDGYESGHVVRAAPRAYPINYDSESEVSMQSFQSYPYPHSPNGSESEQQTNYDSDGSSVREISPPLANHTRARRVVIDSDDEDGEGEDTEREDSPAPQFSEVESESAADHSSPAGSISEDNDIDSEDEDSDDTATLQPPQASSARYQRLQQHRYNRMRRASSSAEPIARPPARRGNYQGGAARSNVDYILLLI